jgi:hypothetical protein
MAEPGDAGSGAALEALRRRVYGPDATDEDRRAYAALVDAPAPEAQEEPPIAEEPTQPRTRRRRRFPILIGAAGVAVVVGLVAVATSVARTEAPRPAATPSATSIWLGAARPTAGPSPTPLVLPKTSGVVDGQQIAASGSAIVPLRSDDVPRRAGRLVVLLSSSDPSPVGWVAERPRAGSRSGLEQVAIDPPALRQGTVAPRAVSYTGAPPTRIVVRAPEGTGWTLTVAFLE